MLRFSSIQKVSSSAFYDKMVLLLSLKFPVQYAFVTIGNPEQDPEALCLDGRFNHHLQLQNRLDFIR